METALAAVEAPQRRRPPLCNPFDLARAASLPAPALAALAASQVHHPAILDDPDGRPGFEALS